MITSLWKRFRKNNALLKSIPDPEQLLREIGLQEGHVLLDAGCGDGVFALSASGVVGSKGKVFAVDNHQQYIYEVKKRIEREKVSNVEAFMSDITESLPVDSKSIDVVLMADVLHGFITSKEMDDTLREVARVLKAGGTFTVIDFKKMEGPPGPAMSIRMTPEEIESIITPYGFKRIKTIGLEPYHYAVVFKEDGT